MKKREHKLAENLIKRKNERIPVIIRIPPELKTECEKATQSLETSMNRFTVAALEWYLETLKKEGSL